MDISTAIEMQKAPKYTENGSLIVEKPTSILYASKVKLSDEQLAGRTYIPPPAGIDLQKIVDSVTSGALQSQRFASNIYYRPARSNDGNGTVCTDFPPQAKAAVIAALDIWSLSLNSSVPIVVNVCWGKTKEASTLAYAKESVLSPTSSSLIPIALANALAGFDKEPTLADFDVTINSAVKWNFLPTVIPTNSQFDLTTTLLHEYGHALGLNSDADNSGAIPKKWTNPITAFNTKYDTFLRDGNGNSLINRSLYKNGSVELATALASDTVWL